MRPDPYKLIDKYYSAHSKAKEILVEHSRAVKTKAVDIGLRLKLPDDEIDFIAEATLLHDIGMFKTDAPSIGCNGSLPYICHGYIGHDIIVDEGFPRHALVCERHTGTGLTIEDIKRQNLPLPHRPMVPVSITEKIIAYADKFFSKDPGKLGIEQDFDLARKKLLKHGEDKVKIFEEWHRIFTGS